MKTNELQSLSIEELNYLIRKNYKDAEESGILDEIMEVARHLGERQVHNYGPKFLWERENIKIYVDDYGRFMTVHLNEKLVCSTHDCELLFIPGKWTTQLAKYIEQAREKRIKKLKNEEEKKKRELIDKLTI